MNNKQLDNFKKRLEQERALVIARLQEHACRLSAAPDRDATERLRSDCEQMEVITQDALAASEESLLKKIELALKRIEDGAYGNCLVCGETIPNERLEAKPSVALCIACQENKEGVRRD